MFFLQNSSKEGKSYVFIQEKAPFANGASLNKLDPLPAETKELWHDMFECVATIQQGYVKPDYDWENCFIEPVKENGKENGGGCTMVMDIHVLNFSEQNLVTF